jgi:acetyl-CoA C-acetyltransferase
MARKVYIKEAERTQALRKSTKGLIDLLCEPAQKILSRFDPARIDGVYVSVQNVSEFGREGNVATKVADRLGLRGVEAERVETSSNAQTALQRAYDAVASGRCENVLAIGGEKMSEVERAERQRIIDQVIDPIDRRCGLTMAGAIALLTAEFMRHHSISDEQMRGVLEKIALREYRYASLNPNAQFFGNKITADDYRDATRNPMVASPFRLFDCCPTSDASGAVLVCKKETDIEISGVGHSIDASRLFDRQHIDHLEATRWAARKAYKIAGIRDPRDVSGLFVELHDAFGSLFLLNLIDLGLFKLDDAVKAIEKGTLNHDGKLPVNVSGGLKDLHALGGTGIIKIVDAVKQMRGQAPKEAQIPKPKTAICQSIGGPGNNISVTVLDRTGNRRYRHHFRRWKPEPLEANNDPHKPVLERGVLEVTTAIYARPGDESSKRIIGVVNCAGKRVLATPARAEIAKKCGDEVALSAISESGFQRYVFE